MQHNESKPTFVERAFPNVLAALVVLFFFVVSINVGRTIATREFAQDCNRMNSVRIKSQVFACRPGEADASVHHPAKPAKASGHLI